MFLIFLLLLWLVLLRLLWKLGPFQSFLSLIPPVFSLSQTLFSCNTAPITLQTSVLSNYISVSGTLFSAPYPCNWNWLYNHFYKISTLVAQSLGDLFSLPALHTTHHHDHKSYSLNGSRRLWFLPTSTATTLVQCTTIFSLDSHDSHIYTLWSILDPSNIFSMMRPAWPSQITSLRRNFLENSVPIKLQTIWHPLGNKLLHFPAKTVGNSQT